MDRPSPPVDHLSCLPEHLQDEILVRLELRDAVRTSALSRAWRRRWETVPGLALSFRYGMPASVVDRVLLRYAGPSVSRFASHLDAYASHVDEWLIALSRRGVESISIIFYAPGRTFAVHSSIFSCDRLVSLTLERCRFPPFPQPQSGGGFAGGFPVLKELYLTFAEFADDAYNGEGQLQAMIRASPMLRVLLLEEVDPGDEDCVIDAPNLHTLGLISCTDFDWQFGDLPCLQYASIDVPDYLLGSRPAEVLAGVSHVQELILNLPECCFKYDPIIPFTFYNLTSMELLTNFCEVDKILLMFCLLRSSPNLEKLKIELQHSKTVAKRKFLRAQWTDGMCAILKDVQITSCEGWLPLTFIKLILSKAKLLHTLSVDVCPDSQDDRLNELLNYRKASPQAQVLFKEQLERICFNRMRFAKKRLNEGTSLILRVALEGSSRITG